MKSIRELLGGRPPVSLFASATVLEAAQTMHEAKIGAARPPHRTPSGGGPDPDA